MVVIMLTSGVMTNVPKNADTKLTMEILSLLSGFRSWNSFFGGSLMNKHR
jgi:hypothetical protein